MDHEPGRRGVRRPPEPGLEVNVQTHGGRDVTASATRKLFESGRTCGECLLLATDRTEGPGREVLVRSIRGLSAGRAGTCSLLVAGLLAIAERTEAESERSLPSNDWLETYIPDGGPGSPAARGNSRLNEFRRRFESRARAEHGGLACFELTRIDWETGHPATSPAAYPDERCVRLMEAAVTDLNEMLADA